MKSLLILSLVLVSLNSFAQTKARNAALPGVTQAIDTKKKPAPTKDANGNDIPCADSKEDVLKKLEYKKKAEAEKGKGFSLQGAKDTGCSI